MHSGTTFFWYRNLGGVGQFLFVTRNLDARDSNAALLLAGEICIHMIHRTRSPSFANKLALLINSLIIIALFLMLINSDGLR